MINLATTKIRIPESNSHEYFSSYSSETLRNWFWKIKFYIFEKREHNRGCIWIESKITSSHWLKVGSLR